MDHTGGASVAASGGTLMETGDGAWELRAGFGFQDHEGVTLPGGLGDPSLDPGFLSMDGHLRLNSDVQRLDGFASARSRFG